MTHQPEQTNDRQDASGDADVQPEQQRVVVVTQDGMGVAPHSEDDEAPTNPADLVEQPAKVMRIGSMIKQLLEEVRNAPLDEAGRVRLAEIHRRSIEELKDGLAPELIEELDRIALPFARRVPHRCRAADRPGPARRLARGPVPRHPDRAVRPADGRPAAAPEMRRALPPGHSGPAGAPVVGVTATCQACRARARGPRATPDRSVPLGLLGS